MPRISGSCLLALGLLIGSPEEAKVDSCVAVVPRSLRAAVRSEFRGFRLPSEADNLPEDVQYSRAHGGNGCLGAARGDFNGDGRTDVALLLSSEEKVLLVVAFRTRSSWRLETLWLPQEAKWREQLYVERGDPGTYEDLGLTDVLEAGQVESFTSKVDVVITGMTESTAIAFHRAAKGWVHAWISD